MKRALIIGLSIVTLLIFLAAETYAKELTVRGHLAKTVEAGTLEIKSKVQLIAEIETR